MNLAKLLHVAEKWEGLFARLFIMVKTSIKEWIRLQLFVKKHMPGQILKLNSA
jgi:hypothetical protein